MIFISIYAYMTRRLGAFVRNNKLGAKISNYEWGVLLLGAPDRAHLESRQQVLIYYR